MRSFDPIYVDKNPCLMARGPLRVDVVALPSQSVLKRGIHSWPDKVPISSIIGS